MKAATASPAQTFAADVQRDISAFIAKPDRFQRKAEILWREMVEDGLSESEALETLLRGVVREAQERAREAGRWNAQELHDRATCLERAADEMLGRVAAEMEKL